MNEGKSIVHAGLALVDGSFRRDVALLIEGARISERGTRQSLEAKYPAAPVFGSENLLMLPGFINSHDHGRALGTVSLGVPDDMLEVWLLGLGTLPFISPRLAAEFEGLQLIRSGVTSVAHSHNPANIDTMFEEVPQTLAGYRRAGVRVAMFPPLIDSNTLVYRDPEAFIASLPTTLRDRARARAQPPGMGWLTGLTDCNNSSISTITLSSIGCTFRPARSAASGPAMRSSQERQTGRARTALAYRCTCWNHATSGSMPFAPGVTALLHSLTVWERWGTG